MKVVFSNLKFRFQTGLFFSIENNKSVLILTKVLFEILLYVSSYLFLSYLTTV